MHSIGGGLVTQKHYIGLWLEKVTTHSLKYHKTSRPQQRLTTGHKIIQPFHEHHRVPHNKLINPRYFQGIGSWRIGENYIRGVGKLLCWLSFNLLIIYTLYRDIGQGKDVSVAE